MFYDGPETAEKDYGFSMLDGSDGNERTDSENYKNDHTSIMQGYEAALLAGETNIVDLDEDARFLGLKKIFVRHFGDTIK